MAEHRQTSSKPPGLPLAEHSQVRRSDRQGKLRRCIEFVFKTGHQSLHSAATNPFDLGDLFLRQTFRQEAQDQSLAGSERRRETGQDLPASGGNEYLCYLLAYNDDIT